MNMREDLKRAAELVRGGMTYGEAALKLGMTRNQVAGACNRCGVKAPITPSKKQRMRARLSATQREAWLAYSQAERNERIRRDQTPELVAQRARGLKAYWASLTKKQKIARTQHLRQWQYGRPEAST